MYKKTGEMWESELTDLAVAIFESEKQNREQRMKKLNEQKDTNL